MQLQHGCMGAAVQPQCNGQESACLVREALQGHGMPVHDSQPRWECHDVRVILGALVSVGWQAPVPAGQRGQVVLLVLAGDNVYARPNHALALVGGVKLRHVVLRHVHRQRLRARARVQQPWYEHKVDANRLSSQGSHQSAAADHIVTMLTM